MARSVGRASQSTLRIPPELYERLAELIRGTAFRDVNDFAVFVLRDIASAGRLTQMPDGLSAADVAAVRTRLRALGYIE